MTVNLIFLGFGLLVGQNKQFEYITSGSIVIGIFWQFVV